MKFISKGLKILFVDKIPERFIIKIGTFSLAAGIRVKKFGMGDGAERAIKIIMQKRDDLENDTR